MSLGSLLLYLCDIFWALINSLVCWFCERCCSLWLLCPLLNEKGTINHNIISVFKSLFQIGTVVVFLEQYLCFVWSKANCVPFCYFSWICLWWHVLQCHAYVLLLHYVLMNVIHWFIPLSFIDVPTQLLFYYFNLLSFSKTVETYSDNGYSILPLCRWYNDLMQQLLNQHAPLKTRSVTEHHSAPWINNICAAKRELQHATCWENCTPHQTHCPHRDFCEAEPHLEGPSLSHETRLCNKIGLCSSSRLLHTDSVTDKFMGRMTEPKLPTNIPLSDLPNVLQTFAKCLIHVLFQQHLNICRYGDVLFWDLYLRTW